jgi:uncharacterized membrane protein HdeD (DUF308 family)
MSEMPENQGSATQGQAPAPAAAPVTEKPDATVAATKAVVGKAAPWKAGMAWWVVLAEGVVLAVLGALLIFLPDFSANTVLLVIGAVMLVTAGLSSFRLLRSEVPPERIGPVAFRAGAGVAVGLVVVLGTLFIGEGDPAQSIAVAAILGIGLLLYGIVGIIVALARRAAGASLPIATLLVSGALAVVGLLLVLNAYGGIEQLRNTFQLLGIVLAVLGVLLIGWGYALRQRGEADTEA